MHPLLFKGWLSAWGNPVLFLPWRVTLTRVFDLLIDIQGVSHSDMHSSPLSNYQLRVRQMASSRVHYRPQKPQV
jgi:hypothetical protein